MNISPAYNLIIFFSHNKLNTQRCEFRATQIYNEMQNVILMRAKLMRATFY